jgi:hypothetical protein
MAGGALLVGILDGMAVERPSEPGVSGMTSTSSTKNGLKELERRVAERDRAYREFFEEMDRKRNKIARAIKEFVDPKTSESRRDRIRTYIRQASISNPEDKETLKAAVFDPRFEMLLGDIELALLHAIQERPEPKDKDFLVDMLNRNIMPGWLVYAMVKPEIWDERFVPWLLKMSSEPPRSYETIEILGRMKVKQAVPVLEEALKDPQKPVRRNAAIALERITGTLYDYKR